MTPSRRVRVAAAAAVLLLLGASLAVQAVTIDRGTTAEAAESGPYPGNTLIGVHSYRTDGRIVEVTPRGEVVWEWSVPDSRVFGVQQLENGNVLAAVAVYVPAEDCPEAYLDYPEFDDHCVHNRVVEVDKGSGDVVWEYDWYDEFVHWSEVHDVERLPNGETAIVDMGRNVAFTVNRSGAVTWRWDAVEHLGEGSWFDRTYGSPEREDEHDDWTHMNDIDRLENGNFQLSIRNFDVVIEVDPETNAIVDVIGEPGNRSFLYHQHNPHRLAADGTLLVADSENDRVVEYDVGTGKRVWVYTGPADDKLEWARDADRLPNGNTLVTDSRNNRVVEVNPEGEIVWRFEDPDGEVIPLPYEADRVGVGERADGPSGSRFAELHEDPGAVRGGLRDVETLARFVLPSWMHLPQLVHLAGIVLTVAWLLGEGAAFALGRFRSRA